MSVSAIQSLTLIFNIWLWCEVWAQNQNNVLVQRLQKLQEKAVCLINFETNPHVVGQLHYLCYKTITSQIVPSKAQINIFLFHKNIMFRSQDSSFCIFNHPVIYQINGVTMSISTWDKVHFWICLLNHKSWNHDTWTVDRYKQVQ